MIESTIYWVTSRRCSAWSLAQHQKARGMFLSLGVLQRSLGVCGPDPWDLPSGGVAGGVPSAFVRRHMEMERSSRQARSHPVSVEDTIRAEMRDG